MHLHSFSEASLTTKLNTSEYYNSVMQKSYEAAVINVLRTRSDTSLHGPHPATVVPRREKICREWDLSIIFVHYSGLQMSPKTKKSNEPFLRKSDFKFFPYLTMARNWSKITK